MHFGFSWIFNRKSILRGKQTILKPLYWSHFFDTLLLAHKIFEKTKEKPKIMTVTPLRHTVAFNLDQFFSSFVIYFDNKRYMFESLIICGIKLWSHISTLCIDSIFFLLGWRRIMRRCDILMTSYMLSILSEIRTCDNRWPVVNYYFALNVLIINTHMFLDITKVFFFFKRDSVTYTIVQNNFIWT